MNWRLEMNESSDVSPRWGQLKERVEAVALIDFKNLELGLLHKEATPAERLEIVEKLCEWLICHVRDTDIVIVRKIIFVPASSVYTSIHIHSILYTFQEYGFTVMTCATQIKGKFENKKDTVDLILMKEARFYIQKCPSIKRFILMSGDRDMSSAVTDALDAGKRVTVVTANSESLSTLYSKWGDEDCGVNEKRVTLILLDSLKQFS